MTAKDSKPSCDGCNKIFTKDMELERSAENHEIYCSPDCATDSYYSYMGSSQITFEEMQEKRKENE